MYLIRNTDMAWCVTGNPDAFEGGIWLPRSLVGYSKTTPNKNANKNQHFEFTLPEWKIEQAQLWDWVTT